LASPATSQTSPPSYFEDFLLSLEARELEASQWDNLRSLALRGLSRSTEPWESEWGTVYRHCEGIAAFGEYVFLNTVQRHHAEMLEFILDCIFSRRKGVVLMPRGAAKTTWGNTALIALLIALYPDLRIALVSNTTKQAYDFSRAIRWTYESNSRFRDIFGDCVSPSKWTDAEWLHRDSKWHGSKDVTLFAAGAGSAIISKRFDLILCDDALDEENTASPEAREKVDNWFFKTLMPCLVPDGAVIMIGTRWAEDDLYQKLTDKPEKGGRGWRLLLRQAMVMDDSERGWHSYWPEHWPEELLEEKRIELGTPLFMCAYQNDIRGLMSGNVFKSQDWRASSFYFDKLPEDRTYTLKMGVDLASSEKQRADFTARCITALDNHGEYWVLAVYRDKRETGHAEFIHDGWLAYPKIALVIIEAQQFQSTLVQEVHRDYPYIPVEGKQTDVDKTTRARAVAAKYEAHRMHHHSSLEDSDFEMELLSFPKGHDDMVDALGYSMDLGGGGLTFAAARR